MISYNLICWVSDRDRDAWLNIRLMTSSVSHITMVSSQVFPFISATFVASDILGRKANTNPTQPSIPWNANTTFLMCTHAPLPNSCSIVPKFGNAPAHAWKTLLQAQVRMLAKGCTHESYMHWYTESARTTIAWRWCVHFYGYLKLQNIDVELFGFLWNPGWIAYEAQKA